MSHRLLRRFRRVAGRPRTAGRPAPAALLLALLAIAPGATANLVLDRSIVHFDADQPARQDVLITNTGAETLYLQVDVLAVVAPGTDEEERIQVTDPDEVTLLATPNKLVVPPGGRKLLRLVNLAGLDDQERIYRVNVTPVTPPAQLNRETMAVRVVVAYQMLVIVAPTAPARDLQVHRDGQHLALANAGNANVLLHSGRQCPGATDEGTDCVDLEARRLYAGNSWELDLPFDAPVEFTITAGDEHSRQRFD